VTKESVLEMAAIIVGFLVTVAAFGALAVWLVRYG
jgi:hypothetical protein